VPLKIRYGVIAISQSDESFCVEWQSDHEGGRGACAPARDPGADRAGLSAVQRLKAPQGAASKGAGVGFIEIARQVKPIEFDFMEVDEVYAFFMLRAQI
jgi:hypothetical protein